MNTKEKISKVITKAETILQAGNLVNNQDSELSIGDTVSWNVIVYNRFSGERSTEKFYGIIYGICGDIACVLSHNRIYMQYIALSRLTKERK